MKKRIPDTLINDLNSPVIQFLDGKSSHGDLSEFFCQTITELDKAYFFTPDDRPYSYYFTYVNNTIFGFCESMRSITFLLPKSLHSEAVSNGGGPHKFLAKQGWFDFPVWGSAKPDHALWAKRAYVNALG